MLKIRSEQVSSLEQLMLSDNLDDVCQRIHEDVCAANPGIRQSYDETSAIECIKMALRDAVVYGVEDYNDLCLWSYIRLVSGCEFHILPGIKEMLDEPLLHIKARVRHVAVTFMVAERKTLR